MTSTLDVLKDLERQRDRLDPVAADAAARAHADAIAMQAELLESRIRTIRHSTLTINARDGDLAAVDAWETTLGGVRDQLAQELLAFPKRCRDPLVQARERNVETSLATIDAGVDVDPFALNTLRVGQLLIEAGHRPGRRDEGQTFGPVPWFGSLKEIAQQRQALRAQRDQAQARLDDALLDDAGRAAQQAAIAAKNAQPQRKVRGDQSVYLRYPDGRVEEVEA